MIKKKALLLAVLAMTGVFAHADNIVQKNKIAFAASSNADQLSADEQAFVAKLTDLNRASFCDKLSADQRAAVLVAVKNGASADEAVQLMISSLELKQDAVVQAEVVEAQAEDTK